MSQTIQGSNLSIKNSMIQPQNMSSEEVANYIWNKLLEDLQNAYNQEIVKIQQENINNPAAMQRLIQELGQKYQNKVKKISDAYNAARVAKSKEEIESALDNAQSAIDEMDLKPTPETPQQKKAQEIDKEVNDIAQSIKNDINQILNKLQNTEKAIEFNETLISSLEENLVNLEKADPKRASNAAKELAQAKNDLNSLKDQVSHLDEEKIALKYFLSQVETTSCEISALYQAIMNNQDVGKNLIKLESKFKALIEIQTASTFKATNLNTRVEAIGAANGKLTEFLKSIDIPQQTPNWNEKGQEAYFDITLLPYWSFMDYSLWEKYPNGIIPAAKLDKYLDSIFSQMKEAGVNQINIGFAQFGSINELLALAKWDGNPDHLPESVKNSSSLIAGIMKNFPVIEENNEITNGFKKFIDKAKKSGLKIDLSIGGESAGAAKICKNGETPAGQAAKLSELMNILGIDKIDFDLENTAIVEQNTTSDLREYFSKVHELLSCEKKETGLTAMGSINDWVSSPDHKGNGFFHNIFYDENGNSIFSNMFDNLNLMLYGGDTSYLDIGKTSGWGVDSWLDIIGKENANKIHIGFEDLIDYSNANQNQGTDFDIRPGSTSGEAAAQIFHQIKERLQKAGYSSDLGNPFWWPEYRGEKSSRYQPQADGSANFHYETEKDFWNELNKLEINKNIKIQKVKETEKLISMYRIGAV